MLIVFSEVFLLDFGFVFVYVQGRVFLFENFLIENNFDVLGFVCGSDDVFLNIGEVKISILY